MPTLRPCNGCTTTPTTAPSPSWQAISPPKKSHPHIADWEADGIIPREVFAKAGAVGLLGFAADERFGGVDARDFRYNQILIEAFMDADCGAVGLSFAVHNDICLPYLAELTTPEQQDRWLPGFVKGELIAAIGMTEPGAGSDVAGIRTSAVDAGDHFVVNGAKTFITNGQNADLVITAVRTSPDRHRGLTLLVLERGLPGFERGRNLDKLGLHCQDTSELVFTDVKVPKDNVLGEVGRGFDYMMRNLPQERMQIAVGSLGRARAGLRWTVDYVRERSAFGKPIGALQNTRFALADVATEVSVAEAFIDRCVSRTQRWTAVTRRRRQGETVGDGDGIPLPRFLPTAVRRLRLHAGVPHRALGHRRPRHPGVRRYFGDHARDHRPGPESRAVTVKDNDMQVRSHSLGDIPRRSARRYPDKVAIIDGDVTLTFAEFDELVDRAAAALRDNGFAPGDRIALLAHNCWQYAVLAFATARAAVVLVPINFMLTAEEIAFILGHSRVRGFIVEHELIATAEQAMTLDGVGDHQGGPDTPTGNARRTAGTTSRTGSPPRLPRRTSRSPTISCCG